MKRSSFAKIQGYFLALSAISIALSLILKAYLSSYSGMSLYIQFVYFVDNISSANTFVFGYWMSQALFVFSLLVAACLEYAKTKCD